MPCESYKSALSEAAAGAPLSGALRSHLIGCAACRAALAAEEALFASIDAGLRSAANAKIPASLISSVRARLAEQVEPRRAWFGAWHWTAAGVALVMAIVVAGVMQVHKVPVEPKTTPQIAANPAAATNPFASHNSERSTRVAIPALTAASLATRKHALDQPPRVIVPPDERRAWERFLSTVEKQPALLASLAQTQQPAMERPVTADPIVIATLELKPLEASAASSEANEK
jgi:hypothetical protein